jgi:hypothetical protein
MLFKVKNLGVIAEAEVDLSKDLILLTGQNNTGKTYLAYAIYFLMTKNMNIDYIGDNFIGFVNELPKINLHNWLNTVKNYYARDATYWITFYSSSKILLKDTRISVSFSEKDLDMAKSKELPYGVENVDTYFYKPENSFELEYNGVAFGYPDIKTKAEHFIKANFFNFCESLLLRNNRCFIFTSERSAINIFSRELTLLGNKIFRSKDKHFIDFATERINRYPEPIKDSLDIAENLKDLAKKTSEFAYLAEELEKSILKGNIVVGEFDDLQYKPNGVENNLEIHLTSSLVKSLSPIAFYLRHLAQKNDCIIIDEPELNLHPDNQILVARFLGRLVNEGFKVIVSTHSNFIIREINNLIMLNKSDEKTTELKEKYGYLPENQNETLKPEQVGAYLFRLNQPFSVIPVTETGFNVATIDKTTQSLNECSQDIYFSLFD